MITVAAWTARPRKKYLICSFLQKVEKEQDSGCIFQILLSNSMADPSRSPPQRINKLLLKLFCRMRLSGMSASVIEQIYLAQDQMFSTEP